MSWWKYKRCPVDYWATEAFTQFVNGFISGLGGGSAAGVGMGATTAGTSLGAGMTALNQVGIAITSMVLAAAGNGLKRVIVWHDQHPFPNPFGAPPTQPTPPVS